MAVFDRVPSRVRDSRPHLARSASAPGGWRGSSEGLLDYRAYAMSDPLDAPVATTTLPTGTLTLS